MGAACSAEQHLQQWAHRVTALFSHTIQINTLNLLETASLVEVSFKRTHPLDILSWYLGDLPRLMPCFWVAGSLPAWQGTVHHLLPSHVAFGLATATMIQPLIQSHWLLVSSIQATCSDFLDGFFFFFFFGNQAYLFINLVESTLLSIGQSCLWAGIALVILK